MEFNSTEKNTERFLFSALSHQEEIVLPTFKEQNNLEWVKYGADNMFPNELLSLFERSGIHNAIIETKTRMMSGDGIIQDVEEEEYSEKSQLFIDNANPLESMDDIYRKCAMDYELYGLAYVEVLWGKGRKQIAEIYHMDASKIRWNKINNKGKVDTFWYSRDWDNYRKGSYVPIEIPLFNNGKEARELIPIIRYTPGVEYYAYPDYIASTKWIAIDTEIGNFHFNNLKNGMTPSVFFGFPIGDTTNEERKTIVEKIGEKYKGTNNASKEVVSFYDAEGDKAPVVKVLEMSNADKQYDLLNKTTLQQILIGHKVTNENLVGISTPGKLGTSKEVLQNYQLYFNTVVEPEQQKVLKAFQRIMLVNGMNDIKILNNTPIDVEFTENVLKEILDEDEMRDIIGYEPKDIIDENNIIEDESGVTVENKRYEYDFAGVRTIDKNNANTTIVKAGLDDLFMWRITQGEKLNCPICLERNGTTRTLKEWLKIGIPGIQTGVNFGTDRITGFATSPYSTFCESDCQCKLRKIGRAT